MSLWTEIRKIPSVTRFLCGASFIITVPVLLESVAPDVFYYFRPLVTERFQVWRLATSYFIGPFGISYIFHLAMLYQHSTDLEKSYYGGRSADYAWQLLQACIGILVLNIPLHSWEHTRPLLMAIIYMTSRLAPPNAQTSLFGLVTLPVLYLPYVLVGLDLLMAGRSAAARSITGALVGHLWWWGFWEARVLERFGTAPRWLKKLLGERAGPSVHGSWSRGGVEAVPPRQIREEGRPGGHQWGSGNRLGSL